MVGLCCVGWVCCLTGLLVVVLWVIGGCVLGFYLGDFNLIITLLWVDLICFCVLFVGLWVYCLFG